MLSHEHLNYLAGLVRRDIRKHQASIDSFQARPGQDPAEASEVLAGFRDAQDFRRRVAESLARGPAPAVRERQATVPEGDVLDALLTITRFPALDVLRRFLKRLAGECLRRAMSESQDWHDQLYALEDLHEALASALKAAATTLEVHREANPYG